MSAYGGSPDRLYVLNMEHKKKYSLTTKGTKNHENKQIQSHHEEHEGSEGKPGNAALRSGFMHFAVPATNASPLDHARRAAGGK